MQTKRIAAATLIVLALIFWGSSPVLADTYSGMVIDSTVYSLLVKNGEEIKLFQIRPETQGTRDPHVEDTVQVIYHRDALNGALVADRITVTTRYMP